VQLSDSTDVKTVVRRKGNAMFRFTRRSKPPAAGVRFCDSCAEVTTTDQRAQRAFDAARTAATYGTYGRL
jgi:cell division GTPase FtsZ